jgi:hypothetical protein
MKKLSLLAILLAFLIQPAAASSEQEIVDRCARMLREFRAMPEQQIPRTVLRRAVPCRRDGGLYRLAIVASPKIDNFLYKQASTSQPEDRAKLCPFVLSHSLVAECTRAGAGTQAG